VKLTPPFSSCDEPHRIIPWRGCVPAEPTSASSGRTNLQTSNPEQVLSETNTTFFLLPGSAGSLVAHHSLAQFETTTAVRVKGVITRFEQVNPHSILFVDQKGGNGETERWAVEGPGITQLKRMGRDTGFLKVGDVVEACGYVTKPGVESRRSVSGRLMDGEMLVLADGRKEKWSDYGLGHKCLGPDYQDFHTK
jgi:hypothetical protein